MTPLETAHNWLDEDCIFNIAQMREALDVLSKAVIEQDAEIKRLTDEYRILMNRAGANWGAMEALKAAERIISGHSKWLQLLTDARILLYRYCDESECKDMADWLTRFKETGI